MEPAGWLKSSCQFRLYLDNIRVVNSRHCRLFDAWGVMDWFLPTSHSSPLVYRFVQCVQGRITKLTKRNETKLKKEFIRICVERLSILGFMKYSAVVLAFPIANETAPPWCYVWLRPCRTTCCSPRPYVPSCTWRLRKIPRARRSRASAACCFAG